MTDRWSWNVDKMVTAIRTGNVSVREVVEDCLSRIEAVNPNINAVVEVLAEEALAQADEADRAVKRGNSLGPLHGVPVTTKINVDQKGRATSNGIPAFKRLIAEEDNPVVANLRKSGAIILGRTNTPEFSLRWFSDNPVYGTTLNPWNRGITPGGSSGGAAAAVATGMCVLGHGNDSAGSIRYPAYACGLPGIKPTAGRVPTYNATNPKDRSLPEQLVDAQGLIGRSIADLRCGLDAISQRDWRDPWWVPAPLQWPAKTEPMKVAVVAEAEGAPVHPATKETVLLAAKWLEGEGCLVELAAPPLFEEASDLWRAIVLTSNRSKYPGIEEFGTDRIQRAVKGMLDCQRELTLEEFLAAIARRDTVIREWQSFFERFDALIMPVSWAPPFPLDHDQEGGHVMQQIMEAQAPLLCASILGFPALTAPVALVDEKPMGVQILAGRFREDVCFAAGELLERQSELKTPIGANWAISEPV